MAGLVAAAAAHGDPYVSDYEGSGSGREISMFPTATVVGFESGSVFAREGGGVAELCAVVYEPLYDDLSLEFTVTITTLDGGAKSGEDYIGTTQTLGPFNSTVRRQCLEVRLIDDLFCESDPYPEDFSAVMTTSHPNNVTVVPSRIGIAVDDNIEPECSNICVGFDRPKYVTVEEAGYVQVCVKVLCPEIIQREVFVRLTTSGITAKPERDLPGWTMFWSVHWGPTPGPGVWP
jgi:hypothetical protein